MWIALPDSFISAVAARHLDQPGQPVDLDRVMLRARMKAHLTVLQQRHAGLLGTATVLESPGADYRFRIVVPREFFAELVKREALAATYPNFKAEAERRCGYGSPYPHALHQVWAILAGLQERPDRHPRLGFGSNKREQL